MTTNILRLPFVTFQATTTTTGDWTDQIGFVVNGAALDLTGIAFSLDWRRSGSGSRVLVATTDNAMIANGGQAGILTMAVPLATLAATAPGTYFADLYAGADGHTINLCEASGSSTITHRAGL